MYTQRVRTIHVHTGMRVLQEYMMQYATQVNYVKFTYL